MSWTLYKDLILDVLKNKKLLATDANGKVIEASSRFFNNVLLETGDSLLTESSCYIIL